MSELNGNGEEVEWGSLNDMDDQALQIIAVNCFNILSERWGQTLQEVIWDCYVDIDHEAEAEKFTSES